MNKIEKAAFQLDLKSLKAMNPTAESIAGALLSACSAHDPDPAVQEKMISYLLDSGADVNEMDRNGVTARGMDMNVLRLESAGVDHYRVNSCPQ